MKYLQFSVRNKDTLYLAMPHFFAEFVTSLAQLPKLYPTSARIVGVASNLDCAASDLLPFPDPSLKVTEINPGQRLRNIAIISYFLQCETLYYNILIYSYFRNFSLPTYCVFIS